MKRREFLKTTLGGTTSVLAATLPSFNQPLVARDLYDLEKDPLEQHNVVDNPDYRNKIEEPAAMLRSGWLSALPVA